MNNLKISLLFIFFVMASSVFGQFELIEKVEPQPGKPIIAYEKYKLLSNDLTLIIHEDHSDPIVHVEVGYHVGSARETGRISGFAHFFEHMMFQGSKNIADEEHFKLISSAGGTCNAFTAFDETVYHNNAPSNFTETLLWMEADRMSTHLEGFTQAKFENQRNAVKNEKKQRNDNQPYGMVNEVLFKNLFPNQTYEWTPIGFTDDLDIASFEDLQKFFLRWYKPNNAVLVVSGDVNPEEVKTWVNKYYGTIKKGKPVRKMKLAAPILPYDQYVEIPDNIYLPLTLMVWPTVPEFHKDEKALDLLGYILGGNNSSPLYQKLVKTEDAYQVSASNAALELAGFFSMNTVANYGGLTVKQVETKMREVLAEFDTKQFTIEDLNKAKTVYKTSYIDILDGISTKSLRLSHWSMMLNKSYNLSDEIAGIDAVTMEDIMRVYRTYIKDKKCLVLNVVPQATQTEETEKSKSVNPHAGEAKVSDPQYDGLTYEPPVDNFDRSQRPVVKPISSVKVPEYYQMSFDNGLKIIGNQSKESPKVILFFNMEGGQLLESGKYPTGTASLLASMMTEGTTTYTSEQFQSELDKLGSSISFNSGETNTSCYVTCLKENLDATLKLLEGALFTPRFDAADFKRLKKQLQEGVQSNKKDPSAMANIAYNKILYKGTLLEESSGTFKSVSKIKLDDLKDYYSKFYSPSITSLVISGDITESEVNSKLSFMKKWPTKPVTIPSIGAVQASDKVQIYLIDKPYAPQSVITVAQHHIPFDYNGDYFKSNVMYFPLGGNFNSRLTQNIREDKGFAYSPQSGFVGNKYFGSYFWSADVRTNASDSAIREVMKEIVNYKKGGITEEELTFTKSSLISADALKYEYPQQKANYLNRIITYNLPQNYVNEQLKIIEAMKKSDIDGLASKILHPETMTIIVVGHAYKIRDSLNKLGYGKVKEITLD